ncbi:Hypothetical_protein [Hexamita inflata]|uniref:Hypothetical_protein n=1 Tax=Hexamita inflata TaxID=28002 RepID=A0ABP1JG83_9EUKA
MQIPAPGLVEGQAVGYSHIVFKALSNLSKDDQIFFNSQNNSNYAIFKQSDKQVSFAVNISYNTIDNENVYIVVNSTCNAEIRLVAVAVHHLNSKSVSLTKMQPESTYFAHKQLPWINKRVKFAIDIRVNEYATVWICSSPVNLIAGSDCKYLIAKGQTAQFINIDVEADDYDFYTNYLYYTIQSTQSDRLISAEIIDVYKIDDVNFSKLFQINKNESIHYKLADNMSLDAYFVSYPDRSWCTTLLHKII